MNKTREQKSEVIEELKAVLTSAASVVFVSFNRLSVAAAASLRRSMKERGVKFKVVKKSLLEKALEGVNQKMPAAAGQLALTFGNDVLAPAKEIAKFSKLNQGILEIVGGIKEGIAQSVSEVLETAKIPDLEVLRGMFVNLLASPIRGLVVVLNQMAKSKS